MSKSAVITARVDADTLAALDSVAAAQERSRAWIVGKAIERYLAEEQALIAAIQIAEADIAAGRVFAHDEVEVMFGVERIERDAA